jgi:hypothetical protein
MLLLIAGMIVPGKYLGGTPVSVKEAKRFFSDVRLDDIPKLLVGPWARFGCGLEGGRMAVSSDVLLPPFDFIVPGDPEMVLAAVMSDNGNLSAVDLSATRETPQDMEAYAVRGAHLIPRATSLAAVHSALNLSTDIQNNGIHRMLPRRLKRSTEKVCKHFESAIKQIYSPMGQRRLGTRSFQSPILIQSRSSSQRFGRPLHS